MGIRCFPSVLAGIAGASFVAWSYVKESRRSFDIMGAREEANEASYRYKQIVVLEWKGFVVWALVAVLVWAWLAKIARGEM